ncbi:MAG: acyloxyacyl hydrolase [Bacteroidetes bacterium]|nr:acyloxyacyl hydrolase [Bacteroidota bacterium]
MRTIINTCILFRQILISLVFLFLFVPVDSRSQEHRLFTSNMLIEGRFDYGFLYAQHLELELFNSHLPTFEINFQKETYGKHKWERIYGYPIIGVSFLYTGLGKSPYLGAAYSVFPFIDFPLVRHKKFMFNFRFGLGVGYLTKKFDRLTNYKNLAIGSHLNASANLMLEARYKVAERLTLSLGIALQHFSNGSLKLPNYGLNLPVVSAGVAYRLARENRTIGDRYIPPTEPYSAVLRHVIEFDAGASLGWKNMQAVYGDNYWVYHFYENTFFPVKRKSKWGFGLDLSYDQSHVKILESQGTEVTNKMKIFRPGINGAYMLVLSKLQFILNLGCYLGGMEKSNGPFYEKLSFQYNFTKDFFASVMLKVHWGRADYIGWGLGLHLEKFYGHKTIK